MIEIIDGRKIANAILQDIKEQVSTLSFVPVFSDILVGSDPASIQYVEMKKKSAESVGIQFHNASFDSSITTEQLISEIKKINDIPHMCGVIVQLPLPVHIDRQAILDAIQPELDVDCLGSVASRRFYDGDMLSGLPTVLACATILDSLDLDLKDKKILILGEGMLVGRPLTVFLKARGLAVSSVNSQTQDKESLINEADVIVSAIGQGKYLTGDMLKEGVVLIDAGTSESGGGIIGDIDLESVKGVASYVSPVPGGVGPVTVAMLLQNVLNVAKRRS